MLEYLVRSALRNRLLVLVLFVVAIALGLWRGVGLPIDAFPDTSPVQVQVNTTAPSLSPEEIEQQITLPVELALSGLPGLTEVRSVSKSGFSQVVASFSHSTHVYDARQFIMERLDTVDLPEGVERPQLGPVSTGLGEVLHYVVRTTRPDRSLTELRTLHDWVVKPELLKVPGVAEVNSWGGFEKQYHVVVDPEALVRYGLDLAAVREALQRNNTNVGGGQIERSGESLLLRGLGRLGTVEDIGAVVLTAVAGTPVRVDDVAEVRIGHEIRRGAVTFQGAGEAVLGLGFMLLGENSGEVTRALRERLAVAAAALPEDVVVQVVYDRTDLVTKVIGTVSHNLLLGAALVIVVLFLLLGNLRAGLLVAMTIPMAMLFAVLGMYELSIAATLLSLGAVDFGILVDGSVVMTEANLRALREGQASAGRPLNRAERLALVLRSSQQVVRPIAFGMGIIIAVFLPVLALEGVEGMMFRPMAMTFVLALLGALLIALFLSPVLSYYLLPRRVRPERRGLLYAVTCGYAWLLRQVLRFRLVALATTVAVLAVAFGMALRLGGEFIPRLSEGAVVANVIRLAGVSIPTSVRYNTRIEALLLEQFPDEIRYVWSRIGTAEVATDPMGTELTDIFLALHPRENWKAVSTQSELVAAIEQALAGLPGMNIAYTQPIEMRMNELSAGIRADVAIKIYGDDFEELQRISDDVQRQLLEVEGAADISVDQLTGQPAVHLVADPMRCAREGIATGDVLGFIECVGGVRVGSIYEGQRVFPLVMRLPDRYREDVQTLADAPLPTAGGLQLSLRQLAEVKEVEAPSTINREWGRRLIRVQTNVRDRDIQSFVQEAQDRIANHVSLPAGYVIDWGGQFEHLERARLRLTVIVPLTLLLVFALLYFSLGNLRDVFVIYSGVPFAAVGGVMALSMRGIPFSVSAAIGFIALSGIAVLNGQVLLAAIRNGREDGLDPWAAVVRAATLRLRPVLATAITDAAGFIPMALSTGVGAEVQRPLATVVIGGVLTDTILTLFILPVLYLLAHRAERR